MDNPREDTPTDQYRTRGAFTLSAIRADAETQGMEAAFAVVQVELKARHREQEDLEEAVEEHEAVISGCDRIVDRIVRSFELRLLDLCDKNRDDLRYRRYFAEGLRSVTEADAREVEPKMVRDILKALDEDKGKPGMKPLHEEYFAKLLGAVEAVELADAACTKVEEELAFLKEKTIPEVKRRWVEERIKLHADLTKKFPNDAARVESYFRRFAKPRKKKGGPGEG
ncbi:hypothetical protein [Polyangium jinanense]|uniref:Uncharacterized protein n=1 Tax=Polyangium jinanense TaxID=2829994 RepID=A0A9X3WZN1_9BACT|nr:hypothetical protein [Polyangium jinanense]MDC3954699.1 hypothetical protein [Polyangium jinanense]MDC3981002.1 hypothetical protein [Polyangium jinanense]